MSDFTANEAPVEDELNALQLNVDGEEEEEELSQAVVNRLVALKQIHNDVEVVNLKYKEERAALEKQYELLRAPILEKRKDIVSGDVEVELEGSDSVPEPSDDDDKEVGIPGFWYQCIANHPAIGSLLSEEDLGPLEALTNISCEYNDDYSGFKLTFSFRDNEFFTNAELFKSYAVSPDLLEEKAPALTSVEGTKIEWKHKKNLCMTEVKKKQKAKSGRKAGQIRFITKLEAKQSFFHFFSDPRLDEEEEDDEEEEGGKREGEHEFQLSIDEDYEAGHAFRAEIIPDAILWFTGEALDDMDDSDDDDDELHADEDDDDDDEDDDDDDDEDGPSSSSVPTAGGAGEQPECKQS